MLYVEGYFGKHDQVVSKLVNSGLHENEANLKNATFLAFIPCQENRMCLSTKIGSAVCEHCSLKIVQGTRFFVIKTTKYF